MPGHTEDMTVPSTAHSFGMAALTVVSAIALAGCAMGTTTSPAPSVTRTVTSTASAAPAASATPAQTDPPSGPAAASPAATTGTGAGTRSGACSFDHLSASIGGQDGQPRGAKDTMNQHHVSVVLHNTGSTSCTVQGWPGVSFVGHGNGTQVGGAATLVRNVPDPTVTLKSGGSAQAYLVVLSTSTLADPSKCTQAQVDGLRIYPPGSKQSFFVKASVETTGGVCAEKSISLLQVDAFIPNP